jgi:hypothetical protein
VSTYQWLLVFHVTGAFLLLGAATVAGALNIAALRRDRPSEIVLLFALIRLAVVPIIAGALLALVFGLWLVNEASYGYGDGWIVAALVLFVLGNRSAESAGGRTSAPRGSRGSSRPRATSRAPSSTPACATRSRSRSATGAGSCWSPCSHS